MIRGNTGRKPAHATSSESIDLIIKLKQNKYKEANFINFKELIDEYEVLLKN